ncbi:MAG: xanthine dehydrogenase family protein subunit M [Rhodoferax sp.]|uniref:FAD binding domain-containing protein n=1 Tax=Rhodoferax sp. TaxID=50421 RepID=UPI0026055017|nr:xanthine dehydrogenase family protein subunit M [Rhodoferax sp.]MDD5332540.1 xanthine dehydrogenase family protein subunit M [Rhodoferax sp.]
MRAVLTPSCREELFTLLERHPGALPLAGGTDLLVRLRRQALQDEHPLLCLAGVAELQGICEQETTIAIGAATTFSRIITDPLVLRHAPLLARAAQTIGGPAVRNMATIGGNIRTASPAGDSLPPLYMLEAQIEIASRRATRVLPIGEFITGPGQTTLRDGELISRILLPRGASSHCQSFEKIGRRRSMAISVTSFAGWVRLCSDGSIEEARFAWGSVAPTVLRIPALEKELVGVPLDAAIIRHAAHIVSHSVSPISDIRATAQYRRIVAGKLLVRFLEGLRG